MNYFFSWNLNCFVLFLFPFSLRRLQVKEVEKLRKLLLLLLQQLLKKKKKQQQKSLLKRLRKQQKKRLKKKLLQKMVKRLLLKRRRRKRRRKRLPQLKMGSKRLLLGLRRKRRVKGKPLMMVRPKRSEDPSLQAKHSYLPWALRTVLMDFLLTPTSFITTYDLYCSSSCSARTAAAAVRSSSETKEKYKKSCTLSTFFAASFHSFFSYPLPHFFSI